MVPKPDIERLRALTGIKWRRFGDDVIPAWVADMDFATAPAIVSALSEMVEASDFGYNMASFGDVIPAAWAAWSAGRFGWEPAVERTRVFSTSLQAIAAAVQLGTGPGDGVVLFTPVYPPFFHLVTGAGRRVVEYALDENDGRIDAVALRDSLDDTTTAIILCNPHNPLGRAFSAHELEAVLEVAHERDLLVISDEIWQDIVYPGATHTVFASLSEAAQARTVTVTAASKSFSLGGLSCAVAHLGSKRVLERICAMPPHLLGGVNALGARATLEAWTHGEPWLASTVETLGSNRDHLISRFTTELPQVRVTAPQATYLAWLDFQDTPIAADPAAALLDAGRVALSPGPDFGERGAGFARLNFATHRELLDEIIDRIVATVDRTSVNGGRAASP